MSLNESKGNMYPFVDFTWNTVKGVCPHDCEYCYMKRFKLNERRFDEKELRTDLGSGNFIFVGSSNDMFEQSLPAEWIERTLEHCRAYPNNKYLFQTKNPERFFEFWGLYPMEVLADGIANGSALQQVVFGTTIESNFSYFNTPQGNILFSNAPSPLKRYQAMSRIIGLPRMVTIEPIMDFDVDVMVGWMEDIKPSWVNIGADSQGYSLPEPSADKIARLVCALREFTDVKLKDNLKRLYKSHRKLPYS